ncbi:MAG: NERD domain-containing protein [Lachnospiraceae bacterium]|nr:NERD domain-containing protein [Lachnospiraceae bacterium]
MNEKAKEIRKKEILERLGKLGEGSYKHEEIAKEYESLVVSTANVIFDKEHTMGGNIWLKDVKDHIMETAKECKLNHSEEMKSFLTAYRNLDNAMAAYRSGIWGENIAFQRLELMKQPYKLIRNIEITDKVGKTEIDGVVITKKAIFILEIKNTKKDILITEEGDYTTLGTYVSNEGGIKWKMGHRLDALKAVLNNVSVPKLNMVKLVVFNNEEGQIINRCSSLRTCLLSQLPSVIEDYQGRDLYSELDMNNMARYIEKAREEFTYTLDGNPKEFKERFASIVATIEMARTDSLLMESTSEVVDEIEPTVVEVSETTNLSKVGMVVGILSALSAAGYAAYKFFTRNH